MPLSLQILKSAYNLMNCMAVEFILHLLSTINIIIEFLLNLKNMLSTYSIYSSKSDMPTLNMDRYFYHAIGFDMYKFSSILTHGILSKNTAEEKKISIGSTGKAYNESDCISVATSEVLSCEIYAGKDLSFIIEKYRTYKFKPDDKMSSGFRFEKQIYGEIPVDCIKGVLIPDKYSEHDLMKMEIVSSYILLNPALLEQNIKNLNAFYDMTFHTELLSDERILFLYEIAREFKPSSHSFSKEKEKNIVKFFNQALISWILKIYKIKLNLSTITLVDIIKYHTQGKINLYNKKGHMIHPEQRPKIDQKSEFESLVQFSRRNAIKKFQAKSAKIFWQKSIYNLETKPLEKKEDKKIDLKEIRKINIIVKLLDDFANHPKIQESYKNKKDELKNEKIYSLEGIQQLFELIENKAYPHQRNGALKLFTLSYHSIRSPKCYNELQKLRKILKEKYQFNTSSYKERHALLRK